MLRRAWEGRGREAHWAQRRPPRRRPVRHFGFTATSALSLHVTSPDGANEPQQPLDDDSLGPVASQPSSAGRRNGHLVERGKQRPVVHDSVLYLGCGSDRHYRDGAAIPGASFDSATKGRLAFHVRTQPPLDGLANARGRRVAWRCAEARSKGGERSSGGVGMGMGRCHKSL